MNWNHRACLIAALAALSLVGCREARSRYWIGKGDASRNAGQHDAAATAYAKAAEADPTSAKAWLQLGSEYLELWENDRAVSALEQAVRCDANSYEGWHNLGLARLRMSKPDEAASALDRAIAIDPKASEAYLLSCTIRGAKGEWLEALGRCEMAARLSPGDKRATGMLAFVILWLEETGRLPPSTAARDLIDDEARARAKRAYAATSIMQAQAILNGTE
jgi:tetratricopeptide (TPR) repeat protein